MTRSVRGMGRRVCVVPSGRLICCLSAWVQVGALLGSGSLVSTHRCRFGERETHISGVSASPEKHKTMCRPHPLSVTVGHKKSLPFLGELVYSIALQAVVALPKTSIAKITKGPQPPVAALKPKYPMAFRNLDQLPVAGDKITNQPSKSLSFTLT